METFEKHQRGMGSGGKESEVFSCSDRAAGGSCHQDEADEVARGIGQGIVSKKYRFGHVEFAMPIGHPGELYFFSYALLCLFFQVYK